MCGWLGGGGKAGGEDIVVDQWGASAAKPRLAALSNSEAEGRVCHKETHTRAEGRGCVCSVKTKNKKKREKGERGVPNRGDGREPVERDTRS